MRYLLILAWLALSLTSKAQSGCTDPHANNYDPVATVNDGSCTYPITLYAPTYIAPLDNTLIECSGMIHTQQPIALNDSGNPSFVYLIDSTSGAVTHKKLLGEVENIDWEAMTSDDNYVYVADVGNNSSGNRQNLAIYIFPIGELAEAGEYIQDDMIQKINFSYEDQTDFTPSEKNSTSFDCEAIIAVGDSLYLFAKDWLTLQTRYYSLPKMPGTYQARLIDSLNVGGLVTDATAYGDTVVVLLGSKFDGTHFLQLLYDFPDRDFFTGNKRQISMQHVSLGQPEAITLKDSYHGYIGTEEFNFFGVVKKQALFSFSIEQWLQTPNQVLQIAKDDTRQVTVSPNPAHDSIKIFLPENETALVFILNWFDETGRLLLSEKQWRMPGQKHLEAIVPEGANGQKIISVATDKKQYFGRIIVK